MRPGQLSSTVFNLIKNADQYEALLLSAISAWEFCKLAQKGRIGISCSPLDWIATALKMPTLRFVHLTPVIAYQSTVLPTPFHVDPADQIIVATARAEKAVVLTKDKRILKYPYVESLW